MHLWYTYFRSSSAFSFLLVLPYLPFFVCTLPCISIWTLHTWAIIRSEYSQFYYITNAMEHNEDTQRRRIFL